MQNNMLQMKLALQKLQMFASGCYDSEIAEGVWRAHRLPAAMRPFYDTEERFQIRMACTSCVRLRFISDTKRLKVALRYGVEARSIYQGALLVDGKFTAPVGPKERREAWEGTVFEQPDAQERLFDLWLPHLCQADVVSIKLDDACSVVAAPQLSTRWLAYGDSITQGMTSSLPILSVIGRCALALNAEVHNVALGSATAESWMADTVPDGRYDLISIAYGTNEFNKDVPVSTYQQNVRRLAAPKASHMSHRAADTVDVGKVDRSEEIGCHLG
jgi:hypothetical protein